MNNYRSGVCSLTSLLLSCPLLSLKLKGHEIGIDFVHADRELRLSLSLSLFRSVEGEYQERELVGLPASASGLSPRKALKGRDKTTETTTRRPAAAGRRESEV